MYDALALFALALPLVGAVLARALRRVDLAVAAVAASFALSLLAFAASVVAAPIADDALFRIDRLAALMMVLVSGVSTVVHAYAVRAMNGDPGYHRFFAALGALTGSVLVVVTTNALPILAVGWIAVSAALYALQMQYRDRPEARSAARMMARLRGVGDASLVAACILLAFASGTLRIDEVLAAHAALAPSVLAAAALLLAIAAFAASAQVPFHRWLPETMEAPTPVSALMHAGVVNAGGILLARFAPIVAHAAFVPIVVFVVGIATAFWGAACLLVRTDVKRGLAFSTVAQMGYMIAQCGLGAFPAAVTHLVAHGLFKATLFLGSGLAVGASKNARRTAAATALPPRTPWIGALAGCAVVPYAIVIGRSPLAQDLPPYGIVLLAFACLTLMHAAFTLVRSGALGEWLVAGLLVAAALPAYLAAIGAADRFLALDATALLVPPALAWTAVGLFALTLLTSWRVVRVPPRVRDRVYVWLLSEALPFGRRA